MTIQNNINLQPHNTFNIKVIASKFIVISTEKEIQGLLETHTPDLILGGGSNVLFRQNVKGLVLKNDIRGKRIIEENEASVTVQFGAGENWHECVLWCLERGFGGIENLSLIPGTIGAAPMQNIGAYGVELKDVFVSLSAVHLHEKTVHHFSHADCKFGYRDSVFKQALKGQYFITSVTLRLTKKDHQLNTSYGAIQEILTKNGIQNPDIRSISDAVIEIRQSKLPDPSVIGNAGSFFKNPIISRHTFDRIKTKHPAIFCYEIDEKTVKVPAGWLIDQCGWKGKRIGQTGTYKNQALVLVNHGEASGGEVWNLAERIQASVQEKFGIKLSPEVNVY